MSSFSGIKNTLLAEQADEEAAPAHDPNQKQQGPGAICSGALLSLFMDNGHVFSGSSASAVTTMKRTVVCFP